MDKKKITSYDIRWMFTLFGTAVGAGILFLPIRAGTGGFWPIVVMCFLIFPMVWLSHRALARFVNSSQNKGSDITKVMEEHFGFNWGFAITILYSFAIYPLVLAYGVAITNTVDSFIVNQLQIQGVSRFWIALALITLFTSIMLFNKTIVTKICNALTFPLCAILLFFSIYLIPHWKFDALQSVPSFGDFVIIIWLTLPVLVFAFNHSPISSTFALDVENQYGEDKHLKTSQIEFGASVILLVFIMFFTFSCMLCLNPDDFAKAREANIPILSYFANSFNEPIIAYGGPAVAFLGIFSSYFGHYYGAHEGINGIVRKSAKLMGVKNINLKTIDTFTVIFIYTTVIAVAYINPNVLGFIENLGGPIIATILFIMPMVAFYKIPSLAKFRNAPADAFVFITGSLAILSVLYGMF